MSDDENSDAHNLAYSLRAGKVISRPATPEELSAARKEALEKLRKDTSAWAMRSCWVCNPAHNHFLRDTSDGFLFNCVMGCGRYYYNGIDITQYEEEPNSALDDESNPAAVRG
jgi:hypothetical protein